MTYEWVCRQDATSFVYTYENVFCVQFKVNLGQDYSYPVYLSSFEVPGLTYKWDVTKYSGHPAGADKSAVGTINRPLRGCAASVGDPTSFFKVHYQAVLHFTDKLFLGSSC